MNLRDRFAGGRIRGGGFTLIELLVVVAIVAVLTAILLPALGQARTQARIVRVHADLRQICTALESYMMDQRDKVPPTRSACGSDVLYQLPVELAEERYFPRSPSGIPQADFVDLFDPPKTYKYRAPGAVWYNGTLFDFPDSTWRRRARIWVPDDFPLCESLEGRFYANRTNEPESPVVYAVWSIGPDPRSPRFPRHPGFDTIDESEFPVSKRFWLRHSGDTGLITFFRGRKGHVYTSP